MTQAERALRSLADGNGNVFICPSIFPWKQQCLHVSDDVQ